MVAAWNGNIFPSWLKTKTKCLTCRNWKIVSITLFSKYPGYEYGATDTDNKRYKHNIMMGVHYIYVLYIVKYCD